MSLVEKAIKKMQESSPGNAGSATVSGSVFGQVVSSGIHKALPASAIPASRPVSDKVLVIDQQALRIAGLLPPADQDRRLAGQYRQIKRPLIAKALGRGTEAVPNGHLIMMASALPGEGKTFTSINLAFSLSLERDLKVLLVDADLPKPHISKLLGIESEPGLLDALRDSRVDIENHILPTNIPNMLVLPAGAGGDNATELLASDRMREVASRLIERDSRRIVLFDSPPLLLTTESQALAQVVGQVVIVVRAGVTTQNTVLEALTSLGERARCASLVLNQSAHTSQSGYYYYGYGEQKNSESASRGQ